MSKNESGQIAIVALGIFIVLSLGAVAFFYNQNQALKSMLAKYQTPTATPAQTPESTTIPSASPSASGKACTLEARICPDGTAVGRTGPNCEFAACPTSPTITNVKSGQKVVSPLTVKGTVPTGWMFEGVFPIKLLNSKGEVVAQAQAKENIPGSWQNGRDVDFTAVITFSPPASGSGKLRLENDNPSGIPQNSKKFDLPVSF